MGTGAGTASAPERIRAARAELLGRTDVSGRTLGRRLCDQMDGWFASLSAGLPSGWALAATGGYAAGQLAPGSDVDVVLLHPDRGVSETAATEVSSSIWYPLWDAGLKLSPATHCPRSLTRLAADDLVTATSLLGIRLLGGDVRMVEAVRADARARWRKHPWSWLDRLALANHERWERHGDVASLLEPDLKDGHGGLRDHDAIRWALLTERDEVVRALEGPPEDLAVAAATVAAVRVELHRTTGRSTNVLLLPDQDAVAAAAGYDDADDMMLAVSAAARLIEWTSDRFWGRLADRREHRDGRGRSGPVDLGDGARLVAGEVSLATGSDPAQPATTFRVAAAAAHGGFRIARATLLQLANATPTRPPAWDERTRQSFLSLLGAGPHLVETADALEHHGLWSRFLPEWEVVRSRPQRNAFHRYTVDRHLLQTVVEADRLVRRVSRPDLLLVGALLHDIGKGHPGDHTEVGTELVDGIARRMGFDEADVDTLRCLVDCHLLLPETATRRDLDDPRTAEIVAHRVGDLDRLGLLHALTEADGRATGPTAWTAWKAGLVDQLVDVTAAVLRGHQVVVASTPPTDDFAGLVERAHTEGAPCLEPRREAGADRVLAASVDRRGLFADIAGTFALHGVEVRSADVWTTPDGVAVDRFVVDGVAEPDWGRVEADLRRAVNGELDVAATLAARARRHIRRTAQSASPPQLEVIISNDESATTTMIDARAPDGVAVLYRLAAALRDLDLDIRSAKVVTLGHEVVDVFYVSRVPVADHPRIRATLLAALGPQGC